MYRQPLDYSTFFALCSLVKKDSIVKSFLIKLAQWKLYPSTINPLQSLISHNSFVLGIELGIKETCPESWPIYQPTIKN